MTLDYVLENINQPEKQKILSDAHIDKTISNTLNQTKHLETPGITWSYSYRDNSYMFLAPTIREEAGQIHYYFF